MTTQRQAYVLAAACLDLIPGAQLVGGRGTGGGFYYDFHLPSGLPQEMVGWIEDRMRAILREGGEVRVREMVPRNVARMCQDRGQLLMARRMGEWPGGTVRVVEVGGCIDLLHEEGGEPGGLKWKLGGCLSLPGGVVRVFGVAARSEKEVRQRVKLLQASVQGDHRLQLARRDLMGEREGSWDWHPEGEALRQQLLELWRGQLKQQRIDLVVTHHGEDLTERHLRWARGRVLPVRIAECAHVSLAPSTAPPSGLLTPKKGFVDRVLWICEEEERVAQCISFLQFILKILKMQGFESQWVLASGRGQVKGGSTWLAEALTRVGVPYVERPEGGPMVQVRIGDGWGGAWDGPFVQVVQPSWLRGPVLVGSAFGCLERFVALWIEREGREA